MADIVRLKWQVAKAIRRSRLDPLCRLILWTLLDLADVENALVPAEHTPSLSVLAADTGMSRSTVAEHLKHVERDGWLQRSPPPIADQLSKRARTRYRLLIPTSPGHGLVRETDQSEGPDDWSVSRTSPSHGPELVRDTDRTSPGDGHISDHDLSDPRARERSSGALSEVARQRAECPDCDQFGFIATAEGKSTRCKHPGLPARAG